VRLLVEIPVTGLSDQVRNLRSTLLRGSAHSAELEAQSLDSSKHSISQAIPGLFGLSLTVPSHTGVKLKEVSPAIRLELGIWLRQHVAQHAEVHEQ
jgi:mediator of RNA polymerase II transcription subunit 12